MSFWRSFAHLVWSTKNRAPLIQPAMEPQIHAVLIDTAAKLD